MINLRAQRFCGNARIVLRVKGEKVHMRIDYPGGKTWKGKGSFKLRRDGTQEEVFDDLAAQVFLNVIQYEQSAPLREHLEISDTNGKKALVIRRKKVACNTPQS